MLRPQSLLQSQQHKHSEPENDSVLELPEVEAIVSARYTAEKSTLFALCSLFFVSFEGVLYDSNACHVQFNR